MPNSDKKEQLLGGKTPRKKQTKEDFDEEAEWI